VFHYNAAISRATQLGSGDGGLDFFDELLDQGVQPDAYSFASAIKASEKDWRQAMKLLDSMQRHKVIPDVFCYTAAAVALRKGNQADIALSLLPRMADDMVEPNGYFYATVISACERPGKSEEAFKLLAAMRSLETPSPFVWASAVQVGLDQSLVLLVFS
jgi:pentatricopeptide repeat protein